MYVLSLRMIEWAFLRQPLQRTQTSPANAQLHSHAQDPTNNVNGATDSRPVFRDALDLIFNLRGIGWDWSRGLYIPSDCVPAYKNIIRSADLILPNQFEAETLSGVQITSFEDLLTAIATLHKLYQIPHVIITSITGNGCS